MEKKEKKFLANKVDKKIQKSAQSLKRHLV